MVEQKKEIQKEKEMSEHLQRMYDEYDEVCDFLNSETFMNMKQRSERLSKFISENIGPDGSTKEGAKVQTTAFQKSLLIMQYNNMIAAISSMQAYEGVLRERINYDSFNWRKENERNK